MTKLNMLGLSFILALVGFIFSILIQSMAYWGPGGSLTWIGFWCGVILSYFCSLSSIVCMLLNRGKNDFLVFFINFILISGSILWTTFIMIAWLSGM